MFLELKSWEMLVHAEAFSHSHMDRLFEFSSPDHGIPKFSEVRGGRKPPLGSMSVGMCVVCRSSWWLCR